MSHVGPEHVAGEAQWSHQIQIGLFMFFIIVWILDSFIFRLTALDFSVPLFLNAPLGIIIVVISLVFMSKSHIVFEGPEPHVVATSVYAHVRHPMYLGIILLYVGVWIITLSLLTVIPLVAVIVGYNYLANVEERLLEDKFGDEYREYKNKVPKWIPH